MSRAEELSQNRYPTLAEKYAFIDGYEQAEKDNELTWEDIRDICSIHYIVLNEYGDYDEPSSSTLYQEILKRFKDLKYVK